MPALSTFVLLTAAAFTAGAVNSVAGGGTLLTFPSLLGAGLAPLAANATSTLALVPGSAGAFVGLRGSLDGDRRLVAWMAGPSVLGGVAGTLLVLRAGDAVFATVVPWLILAATLLFLAAEPLSRWIRGRDAADRPVNVVALAAGQLFVALYGGFFGAGIGILMLAGLAIAGVRDVHRMNALKNLAAVCINGVSAITFALSGRVDWPVAGVMALGAVAGGRLGAGLALRAGQANVRRAVVIVGMGIAAVLFARQLGA
jgi:hypothetical protein